MIELCHLTRHFGTTCAVDDLSFAVQGGEVFGFIGPNGAGKTTSMRILATLDVPTRGTARVDGFSVVEDPDRVRRRLGFMPDNYGTYDRVNCEEYLDFFARAYGLRGNERRAALRRTMGFTQLDRLAQKPISGLSKGMRQRLCLGRALIHDPSVLILDEPAAGLDPRARIELREMIGELASQGKSLLVSSHILTELAEICDRVAIIEQGRLLAVGSVDEILKGSAGTSDQSSSTNTVRLQMTILGDLAVARRWLAQKKQIDLSEESAVAAGKETGKPDNLLQFEFPDDEMAQSELLAEMIRAGIRVSSFACQQRSLEDVFLSVTKGDVQ
ncbi:MAG: ABC transporter ATP-binding protein [Mariniblastus sp.]|nr:ABC transporter ATP-binding protein [Mariniblastus sp.]